MSPLARALLACAVLAFAVAAGAATVTGTVRDSNTHTPLGGMVVATYDATGTLRATGSTDPTGLYVLTLPSGHYRVLAYDPSGIYATAFDANAESFETSPLRNIDAAGAHIDFALMRGGFIAGWVAGVPGAVVEAYNLSGTRRGFTTANDSGEFSLVLPPGDYKLVAYDANGMYAPSFYPNARSFVDAAPVHVTESLTTNIFFTLGLAAHVSGIAVDAQTQAPLPSMIVYAYTPEGALVATTTTDANGAFRFSLAAGQYRFVAADPAGVYATAFYDGSHSFEQSQVVTLAAGEQRPNVRVALTRGGRITGTVRDAISMQPLGGMMITAYDTNGFVAGRATTDATGHYALVVEPGAYRVLAFDARLDYATAYAGGASSFETTVPLTIAADTTTTADFVMRRGLRVTGQVATKSGTALSGMEIFALDANGNRIAGSVSNDGAFTIVLLPGTYRFVAVDPQHRWPSAEYPSAVVVSEGQIPPPVLITMHAFGRHRSVRS